MNEDFVGADLEKMREYLRNYVVQLWEACKELHRVCEIDPKLPLPRPPLKAFRFGLRIILRKSPIGKMQLVVVHRKNPTQEKAELLLSPGSKVHWSDVDYLIELTGCVPKRICEMANVLSEMTRWFIERTDGIKRMRENLLRQHQQWLGQIEAELTLQKLGGD